MMSESISRIEKARAVVEEINRQLAFIKKRDPKKECERMQGARYAFLQIRLLLKRNYWL